MIGAGLTGLSTAFHLHRQGRDVVILEKADRVGGQIHTYHENGFTFESGPNTGVVSFPEVAELFQMLEGSCQLEIARESSKRRLIWKGRKAPIPMSPLVRWLPAVLASRSMSMPLILSSRASMRVIR